MVFAQSGAWRLGHALVTRYVRIAATLLCGGLAIASLAGCVHTDFVPTLTFAVPAKYENSTRSAPTRISRWWTNLGSGELDRLVSLTDFENLDIAIAVAQFDAAQAQADIVGAALWPTLSYADDNVRSRGSGTGTPGRIVSANQRNSFSKQLTASYIVDVWGQNRALLDSALHSASASAYQIEVVRLTAVAGVVNNFLVFAASSERLEVANRNLANAERVLRVIRERREVGTASDFDTAQQGTLVESLRAAIPSLRQAAATARTAIALAVGHPVQEVHLTTSTLRRLRVPSVSSGIPSTQLVRRPDIRSAEQQLAAADANVAAARAAFLPTVQLGGAIGYQSALLRTLLRPESLIFNAAAGLTQTIFDGGRLRGELALSKAQREELLANYGKVILSALIDVENALIAIREMAAREVFQRRAVDLARQAFTLGEDRLRQGTIDVTALLTTQNTLIQAEDQLIQVRLARLQAIVSLYQALGGDWVDGIVDPHQGL